MNARPEIHSNDKIVAIKKGCFEKETLEFEGKEEEKKTTLHNNNAVSLVGVCRLLNELTQSSKLDYVAWSTEIYF